MILFLIYRCLKVSYLDAGFATSYFDGDSPATGGGTATANGGPKLNHRRYKTQLRYDKTTVHEINSKTSVLLKNISDNEFVEIIFGKKAFLC